MSQLRQVFSGQEQDGVMPALFYGDEEWGQGVAEGST